MRPRVRALASLLLVALATQPGSGAADPQVTLVLPVDFEYVTPGEPRTIDGQLHVTFPSDPGTCAGLAYAITLARHPANVTVEIEPSQGTIPASEIRGGESAAPRPIRVRLNANDTAIAYANVDVSLEVSTPACGNLNATSQRFQTGAQVGFLPRVRLEVQVEEQDSWKIRAINEGNARVQLHWTLVQPGLGRVLSGSLAEVPGPEGGRANATTTFDVPRANLDPAAEAWVRALIVYQGTVPVVRPPTNETAVRVYAPPQEPTFWDQFGQYLVMGFALVFLVGAVAAAIAIRRRRQRD